MAEFGHNIEVDSLWRYPISGGPGISEEHADLIPGGIVGDREIVLGEEVGDTIRRIGSKQAPELLGIKYNEDGTSVFLNGFELEIPEVDGEYSEPAELFINEFGDLTPCLFLTTDFDEAFSDYLKRPVVAARKSYGWIHSHEGHVVPRQRQNASLHILSVESVEEVSEKAGIVPDVRRFKPNIVLRGIERPHAELEMLDWHIILGSATTRAYFSIDRVAPRCPVTRKNPETGEDLKDLSLKIMPKGENSGGKMVASLGVYGHSVDLTGSLQVGDTVKYISS